LEATGLLSVSAQALGTGKAMELAQEEIARASAASVQLVSLDDPAYPARLKQIYDPPLILYVRGAIDVLAQPGIAVVGTRHPTPYGSGMAERLAIDLAARGLIIQSGMARGVDTAAHRGAISAKGKTVAVFGTGVDVPYPKENTRLSEQIVAQGGALISEFPLGTFAAPQNFPIRNRIISGMSMGVLVVEAAEYSGTRITARCALEQNREVFAVPGNVTNKNSWGPTLSSSRAPNWLRPGKTSGRNSLRMYDLRSLPPSPMNRQRKKPHLYSQAVTVLLVRMSARFTPCSKRTKPHTSMPSWSAWNRKCPRPKFL
jgi:DNA processing protein